MTRLLMLSISLSLLTAAPAWPQSNYIDFEHLPDGSPVTDGMLIHDQYAEWGVVFELVGVDPGVGPRAAAVGAPRTAFYSPSMTDPECGVDAPTTADMVASLYDVGCMFLTDDGIVMGTTFVLRVNYVVPVFRAYGELLDIDGGESWEVQALGADGELLTTITVQAGDPGTGDGVATGWFFDLAVLIHAIQLIPNGGVGYGLGFDNFSPSSIPHFPVCDAGGPYAGDAGVPIQFDGSGSYDTDGSIVSWHWDFGDGDVAEGVTPVHTYAEDGVYTVVLTVTDNDGNESSCSPSGVVPTRSVDWGTLKAYFR